MQQEGCQMAELLLFQLYGPLASWGEPAVGEYRPTATHPGKSQIVGLLAAALGIKRNENNRLSALVQCYGMAVRIDAEGELLRDYHTTQAPPSRSGRWFQTRHDEVAADKLNTILSQRDYRVEASWTCSLWAIENLALPLVELREALLYPAFNLYLGRKSCSLALPLNPQIVKAETLKGAFSAYPQDARLAEILFPHDASNRHRYCWEEPLPPGLKTGFNESERLWRVPRRDLPGSRSRWQFASRDEYQAMA